MDNPIVISFDKIIAYSLVNTKHSKANFIGEILKQYSCFQDKIEPRFGNTKWQSTYKKTNSENNVVRERTKIGNKSTDKESTILKDLQSCLNKLTHKNYDSIEKKIHKIFEQQYIALFVKILWNYLQIQPEFQELYIRIMASLYSIMDDDGIIEIGNIWNRIWQKYISCKEWQLSKELVEQSHNYQDFCDYVKEKKRLSAIAQAWARLIHLGMIKGDPYELLNDVLYHIHNDIDMGNVVDSMCMECYVEQSSEYYRTLSHKLQEHLPHTIENLIQELAHLHVKKSCQFKIEGFVNMIKKSETKIKSIYDIEDDGL